jgi:hypothetical protein
MGYKIAFVVALVLAFLFAFIVLTTSSGAPQEASGFAMVACILIFARIMQAEYNQNQVLKAIKDRDNLN